MRRLSIVFFSMALVGLFQGPVFSQPKMDPPKAIKIVPPAACCGPTASFKAPGCQTIVFVVNGEAGSTHLSDGLMEVKSDQNLPLYLQQVSWTRHDSHNQDVRDIQAQINAAARIACSVKEIRKSSNVPIFFVGHSGGAHIVLRAAEMLPPNSIDRIIVLAPAVSCSYDLTRALKTSRGGIDNFYSQEDSCLEHMTENAGNADGAPGKSAGLVGFRCLFSDPRDVAAYRNVRQYRWTMDFAGSGGHYTWTRHHNLRKTVVPMFFAPTTVYDGPAPAIKTMPPAK